MDPSTSYTPWWERRQLCAEATAPAGCTETSFLKLECHTEPNEFGVPVKRCIRLHKKLVTCPGRPAEVDEKQEYLTVAGEVAELPFPGPPPFGHGAATGSAASSTRLGDEGQELESLLRLADELHDKFMPGALQLDPESAPEPRPYVDKQEKQQAGQSLLSRLLGGWQARRTTLDEKTWEDYAKEFQEV